MADRDTSGDLYEYLLAKIATAGVNGQFRTPRHIIKLMVDMTAPQPSDEICDPACGTAGFLVAAAEYVREQHPVSSRMPRSESTSTPVCSTATTSTPPCCASAA
jgi:type I restriction-modification system DNA methylase subunit